MKKWRVGTISMGLLLIAIGIIMITGRIYGFSAVNLIAKWWPVILILLGIEILGYNIFAKNEDVKIVFDGFSIFATIVIIVISLGAFGITEAFKYFPDNFQKGFVFSSDYKHVTSVTKNYTIDASGKSKLVLSNEYGDTKFVKGTGKNIEVTANIEIRNNDEEYAKKISDSLVEIVKDNPIKITSKISSYLNDRTKIKGITINYTVKVPDGLDIDTYNKFGDISASDISKNAYIENTNGQITVNNTTGNLTVKNAFGSIDVDTVGGKAELINKNGDIDIKNVNGPVKIDNQFGSITAGNVKGSAEITNKNGQIDVSSIDGSAVIKTEFSDANIETVKGDLKVTDKNGSVTASNIGGDADIVNAFGEINLKNAYKTVTIKDNNGEINFETNRVITGNVGIESAFGNIDISIPKDQQGHFKAFTKFGTIDNDFNFKVSNGTNEQSLEEALGSSSITFNITNKNGNIDINNN